MTLRFEIFPADLDAAVDFYTRVLRFSVTKDQRKDPPAYVALQVRGCASGRPCGQSRLLIRPGGRRPGWNWCLRLTTSPLNATGSWRPDGRWKRISRIAPGT